ncbi:hypothetical protein NDU88_010553 [Pleurodeles waltl]|uniref:Uncharacterized protein n=1 Tax=Pleurodeles waltl TaxID=8319 RepID=A0AAV7S1P6_PLEWA|nr:hypothetical protein NDU88_010553 [Pleurodeles waltl]
MNPEQNRCGELAGAGPAALRGLDFPEDRSRWHRKRMQWQRRTAPDCTVLQRRRPPKPELKRGSGPGGAGPAAPDSLGVVVRAGEWRQTRT